MFYPLVLKGIFTFRLNYLFCLTAMNVDSISFGWLMKEFSSRNTRVDTLLGGGLREGQLTEIVGPSSSGKTQVRSI